MKTIKLFLNGLRVLLKLLMKMAFLAKILDSLRLSVFDSLREVFRLKEFDIKAINFTSYGASFVYLNEQRTRICAIIQLFKTLS